MKQLSETKTLIKKLIRENLSNDCDCCKYFDMNTVNDYIEIEKPLYSIVAKRRVGIIEYISPKQYIYRIANGFGISYEDALGGGYDKERAAKYAERMRNGEKAPVGLYTHDNSSQEGRHRAMAAMMNDCSLIPVVKIKHLNNDEFLEYVNQFKDMDYDELKQDFMAVGYPNGISKLGYNDLKRFVEYNM